MLSREELKKYMGNAKIKDLRTLSQLLIDMLSDKQVQVLNEFFTKKISFSGLVPKKKVPQTRVSEPIEKFQDPLIKKILEEDESLKVEDDDEGVNEDLADYEIDTDLLQQEQPQETTPEKEHEKPMSKEELDEIEKEVRKRMQEKQDTS